MSQPATVTPPQEQAVTTTPTRRRGTALTTSQTRTAWILLLPTLLVVAFIALYPLAQTIYYSFTDKRLASAQPTSWVGLENYRFLIEDTVFRDSIWTTVKFAVITLVFEFVLGLIIALVVNSSFKGRGFTRAAMLIPWAIPTVVSARMWAWMYNDIFGVFNDLLYTQLHITDRNIAWTAEERYSLWAVCAVDIWKTTPFVALLLLAGLQVIPSDVYEAATVDGASKWQQFWRITMPLLRPAILVTIIFRTLDALRVFDVFYVMFGARRSTQTMAVYAQNNLVAFSDIGYGSAIAVGIFLIIGIFVVAYVTTLKVEQT
jgi:trehalose/maltose transport system permease protein